jgi:V-type H+-transporting ATPase subunit H
VLLFQVLKQLELLEQRKFEDEDIQEDIEYLIEKLEASVQVSVSHRPNN